MRIAQLAVGDRNFYVQPDDVESVLAAAAIARERGEWLDLRDAAGNQLRLLIPSQALLVLQEYEVAEFEPGEDPNDWAAYDTDYDL
ncbi:MAG: hypothetical protein ABJB03_01280 [Rhodoglobus sp.]